MLKEAGIYPAPERASGTWADILRSQRRLCSHATCIANTRPPHPLPTPIADPDEIARLGIRRRERLGGILTEYQHAA
ncbi:hypothetical protein ABT009_44645 [Streptomyces sp. NPDC002896]|uniref:hypothetical protein n=1 Tax=Streptomyces sp. NPDC002896 TaxID=3154438 RepID=UPI00331B3264